WCRTSARFCWSWNHPSSLSRASRWLRGRVSAPGRELYLGLDTSGLPARLAHAALDGLRLVLGQVLDHFLLDLEGLDFRLLPGGLPVAFVVHGTLPSCYLYTRRERRRQ